MRMHHSMRTHTHLYDGACTSEHACAARTHACTRHVGIRMPSMSRRQRAADVRARVPIHSTFALRVWFARTPRLLLASICFRRSSPQDVANRISRTALRLCRHLQHHLSMATRCFHHLLIRRCHRLRLHRLCLMSSPPSSFSSTQTTSPLSNVLAGWPTTSSLSCTLRAGRPTQKPAEQARPA